MVSDVLLVEESEVMDGVVLEDPVVRLDEEDLMVERDDAVDPVEVFENDDETMAVSDKRGEDGTTLDTVDESDRLDAVELLTRRDDEAKVDSADSTTLAAVVAVGPASAVIWTAFIPQQEQAEE
jgi:hypothetical protein